MEDEHFLWLADKKGVIKNTRRIDNGSHSKRKEADTLESARNKG